MHDLAEQLVRQAEEVRQEGQRQMPADDAHGPLGGRQWEIGELRRDLDQFRSQVNGLLDRHRNPR